MKIITDIFNPVKLLGLLKNKYGTFVLHKAMNFLSQQEREDMKSFLISKINITSSKEKSRLNTFLDELSY